MVNVDPANHYPLHAAFVMLNSVNQKPNPGESNQERERRNEHTLPRPVGNRGADQVAEPRELQQHQQHHHDQTDKCQEESSAAFGHTLLNHRRATSGTILRQPITACALDVWSLVPLVPAGVA